MDNTKAIVISLIVAIMASLAYRSGAINGDKEIRTNTKFYPKHYALPHRWMRKLFALSKREMARFLIFDLYLSLAHAALAVALVVIWWCDFSWGGLVANCITIVVALCAIIETIRYLIFWHIFKHKQK